MANTLLTPTAVTREALRILHQKCVFIGAINRQYDDSFAKSGAKIGDTLKIRLPNQYTVRSGATLSTQDTTETSVSLQIATQKGVDVTFSSAELTLSLQDFSERILQPAMAVLAANIENDAYSNMYKDVYNIVDNDGAALTFLNLLQGRKFLNEYLTPMDDNRVAMLSTNHNLKLVDTLKGLFHDSTAIKEQYREAMMGRTAGFDFYENTVVTDYTTGTAAKTTGYLSNGATQSGATIAVDTGTTTFLAGDIITFAGVNAVHPETKSDLGRLQHFVVTANSGANATSLAISPAIVATGATKNVTSTVADNSAVVKVGAGASELLNSTMVFHRDAFTFATADLEDVSKYGAWGAREQYDGISMRIARQYAISSDTIPCRIDVLYGYKTIRAQMACRVHADG